MSGLDEKTKKRERLKMSLRGNNYTYRVLSLLWRFLLLYFSLSLYFSPVSFSLSLPILFFLSVSPSFTVPFSLNLSHSLSFSQSLPLSHNLSLSLPISHSLSLSLSFSTSSFLSQSLSFSVSHVLSKTPSLYLSLFLSQTLTPSFVHKQTSPTFLRRSIQHMLMCLQETLKNLIKLLK